MGARKGSFSNIKKAIKSKVKKGPGGIEIDDDANSNLAPFIVTSEEFERISLSSHQKSTIPNKDSTPLKSSIRNREESKFSSGDLQHIDSSASKLSTLSSGSGSKLSTLSSSPHHHRPNSADIEQAKRGVHFQRTFAVKTILTSRINKDQLDELVNEIMIMRKLVREY